MNQIEEHLTRKTKDALSEHVLIPSSVFLFLFVVYVFVLFFFQKLCLNDFDLSAEQMGHFFRTRGPRSQLGDQF